MNEYSQNEFAASADFPSCAIGQSRFSFSETDYGSGYSVSVSIPLGGGKILNAELEWLCVESDFLLGESFFCPDTHCWNVCVPRADVSGRLDVLDESGIQRDHVSFRGTGYHDHTIDDKWDFEQSSIWQRGRFHFADCTAVFCRYDEVAQKRMDSKLFIVRNGSMIAATASAVEHRFVRSKHGITYSARTDYASHDGNVQLNVEPLKILDSSFFSLRALSKATLFLDKREVSAATGLTEIIVPKFSQGKWRDWIANLRRV